MADPGTTSLFTYGTLMLPEVFRTVAGRLYPWVVATLEDHARYRVRGAVFPAVVHEPGERVEGRLFDWIDAATLERLDRYEGQHYERVRHPVRLESGEIRAAQVYVLADGHRSLLSAEPWSLEAFRRECLGSYLNGPMRHADEASGRCPSG